MSLIMHKRFPPLSAHLARVCRMSSDPSSPALLTRKKELVLNPKYGDRTSDPLYADLVYSSELHVALTVKRGKAWMEMQAMKKYQAENERRERERAAQDRPVPLALQYLYGGSARVQREADVVKDREVEVEGLSVTLDRTESENFPYGVYASIDSQSEDNYHTEYNVGEEVKKSSRGRRRRVAGQKEVSQADSDEAADYDVIRDSLNNENVRELFTEDHLFKYGTADPSIPSSHVPCGGCGANLHCLDEKIPGFIPSQLLQNREEEHLRSLLCQRCYIIREYKVALKVNVSPADYPRTIEHIRNKQALVLLVVDLLDFPGSVWPGILDLLGSNKVILVGNKFDLLLPDSKKYQKRITNLIRSEFLAKCLNTSEEGSTFPQVIGSCCVSATTGFNVEKLIGMIFDFWRTESSSLPGDIYIVGCTNVGKSSLFNLLLDSDLCKVKALDLVQKAMISPVPGTTLNLLKFPVTRPEPHFLTERRRRVTQADNEFFVHEQERLENLSKKRQIQFASPSYYAIKHTLERRVTDTEGSYLNQLDTRQVEGVRLPERLDTNSHEFALSKNCFDTPGTVNEDQILNLLTAEEIGLAMATTPVIPRTFLLKPGNTLLLGGIGRLDLLSKSGSRFPDHPIMVTVFCSDKLPINMVVTRGVDEFLRQAPDRGLTGVPVRGGRSDLLPPLLATELEVAGVSEHEGAADIVLSSCGWVMVTPRRDERCRFLAFTPGGRGVVSRTPFLPYSIHQRGKRVMGTPSYKNDRFFIP